MREGALETSWSAAEREEGGPGSCTRSNFQVHSLLNPTDCRFNKKATVCVCHLIYHYNIIFIFPTNNVILTSPARCHPKVMV